MPSGSCSRIFCKKFFSLPSYCLFVSKQKQAWARIYLLCYLCGFGWVNNRRTKPISSYTLLATISIKLYNPCQRFAQGLLSMETHFLANIGTLLTRERVFLSSYAESWHDLDLALQENTFVIIPSCWEFPWQQSTDIAVYKSVDPSHLLHLFFGRIVHLLCSSIPLVTTLFFILYSSIPLVTTLFPILLGLANIKGIFICVSALSSKKNIEIIQCQGL